MSATELLTRAWRERSSVLSVGLEPCPEYLPASGFEPTVAGYERFLMDIAEGSAAHAAAYKFNLAFFEALGPDGWAMLKRVRERLPKGVMVIADAKRGDIGSTAKRYAESTFGWLNADAVTLSPLMGRDSAEPFLAYADRLCYFLCLTSNPGSRDFLAKDGLYLRIAREVSAWGGPGQCGLVVGATHPERVAEIRAAAPALAFLIPGVGAQGGEVDSVASAGKINGASAPGLLFHVTRGVLTDKGDSGSLKDIVARKCEAYRRLTAAAVEGSGVHA